jgi:two-component system, chemotaxis family, protein-glutamate methylesterase/glutaminase
MKIIKLAIADDSSFVRKAVQRVLEREAEIKVVGAAASGEELLEKLPLWKPDVVTLDLSMPGISGIETLERIMKKSPLPVVILSTHSAKDAPLTIEALHKGAVDFIDKQQYSLVDFDGLRSVLIKKIMEAASAKIMGFGSTDQFQPSKMEESASCMPAGIQSRSDYQVLVIGASTGGPPAIQSILESLGSLVTVPIVIVQHMPGGFTKAFAERLDAHLSLRVVEARHADELNAGTVYIAPSGYHLRLQRDGERVVLALASYPDTYPHKPSVDVLFDSAADIYGKNALAVLLTGMGRDGADGMLALKQQDAYTICQNEATCVVYGMPRAANMLGAVKEQLPLQCISMRILELLHDRKVSFDGKAR